MASVAHYSSSRHMGNTSALKQLVSKCVLLVETVTQKTSALCTSLKIDSCYHLKVEHQKRINFMSLTYVEFKVVQQSCFSAVKKLIQGDPEVSLHEVNLKARGLNLAHELDILVN